MSVQFILGNGRMDHQQAIIDEATEWLESSSEHEVYFLVPNYNKFEQEQEILSRLRQSQGTKVFSTTRTQVFSFYRLAWYFLQKTTLLTGSNLSETGASMIFRQVLEQKKEQLTVFRGEINKRGFIQQLQDLYTEMRAGNVRPEDLLVDLTEETPKQQDQQLKMADLQLILRSFEDELITRSLQSEDPLALLTDYLGTQDLQSIKFIATGFSRINAQEYRLLSILMSRGHLVMDLVLDRPYPSELPEPLNLFYETGKMYARLKQVANEQKINVMMDRYAKEKAQSTDLTIVQEVWEETSTQKKSHPHELTNDTDFRVWEAENPTEEMRQLGIEIRRLVSEEGYRYKDIQLLTDDLPLYGSLARSMFQQLEIPYYLDEDQLMENHPLVEWVNSLFSIDRYYYRLSDVMRFYKTELMMPFGDEPVDLGTWAENRQSFRQSIDLAENVALAYNYQGAYWVKDKNWRFISYDFEDERLEDVSEVEEQVNEVRSLFQKQVPGFFEKIKNSRTGLEGVQSFYQFLMASGVQQQLLYWRDQEIERGNLATARNHEQTWGALMDLLDEFAVIYENTPFDWEIFQEILTSGLENLSYGKIPTAIDQVQINRLALARSAQAKITFAVGLNDQIFPARTETSSLLSSEERQALNEHLGEEAYLSDPSQESMTHAPFQAYLVFSSASERLYLSYAKSYETDGNIKMSPYVRRLVDYLHVPIETKAHLDLESDAACFVGTYRSLIDSVNRMYRTAADNKAPVPTVWLKLEELLLQSDWRELAQRVFESQTHLNVPESLPQDLAEALYGKDIYTSISRMENFYNCEYRYFVQFGLKLKERTIYGLTPAATGDFYHESLDRFFKLLFASGKSLTGMTDEERHAFTENVLQEVFGELRFEILDSSARMNYIRYQLEKTIQKVAWALQRQSKNTGLSPLQTEILFGQIGGTQGINGLDLPLKNGGELHVRGKIDRIDTNLIQKEGKLILPESASDAWLSVVDYKSSERKFDVTEAYYGMAMQLLTYLDVALMDAVRLTNHAAIKPAGSYYLHVHNPILKAEEEVEPGTLKQFSYDGLFLDDPELFEVLDTTIEAKEKSLIYPIKKNKDGDYTRTSKDKFFNEEELSVFMTHNRKKMRLAGDAITSGEIKLNPSYKDKQRIACQYCPFRSVCTFDVMLKENNYHRLEKLSKEEALRRMTQGEENNE